MPRIVPAFFMCFLLALIGVQAVAHAQSSSQPSSQSSSSLLPSFQAVVQEHFAQIKRGSVKTAQPVIEAIQASQSPVANDFLQKWQAKALWYRKADNRLVSVKSDDKKRYHLFDLETGQKIGEADKKEIKQIKPNSGLRALLGAALAPSHLASDRRSVRRASLDVLARDPKAAHLQPLRLALGKESDAALKARMMRLERLLTMQYGADDGQRVAAVKSFSGDLGLDVRARLNPMLTTRLIVSQGDVPSGNFAQELKPGESERLPKEKAYAMLVAKGWALADLSEREKKQVLEANIIDGRIADIALKDLASQEARDRAYLALVKAGKALPDPSEADIAAALQKARFYALYEESSTEVVKAARETLSSIDLRVKISQAIDLFLDGLSLASIFFLAAIGLAITFGVMGVINMAHGEFIMLGAYTGYVVQQIITNYTLSILVAIPAAFLVTFIAGIAMERLIIRHLYHRPLETLLATFGVSIALQQVAKNSFGTQARPLTAPDWLDGALVINDVISISWIRVAIFALSLLFFAMLWFTLNKTRLGLETRAVTQNPRMAASMGINPDRINMLTFGLGSGIAGIAGVAIGLFAKVTSELGSDYIVQSFMTVVVGGVGNIWGTLAGATMIGFLQKGIEWFNPSNTLAAQTFMIIFIIIFIQFRPRGIIALKGRAAGD